MLGILVELSSSWVLLYLLERRNLSVLGLTPTATRLGDLGAGLLLPLVLVVIYSLVVSRVAQNPYHRNLLYTWKDLWKATAYVFKSVAYENLIYSGAILYILIQRIGSRPAVWVSAVAFGIYHWFSFGVIGQIVPMVYLLLVMGLAGYLFSLAFEKTGSMYLAFALHFGFDFVSMVVFSGDDRIGPQLLVKTFAKDPVPPGTLLSILWMIIRILGFAWAMYLLVRWRAKVYQMNYKASPF
jgi:uncharacterized protein